MIYAGIDAGSRSIKAVLFDTSQNRTLASGLADQGVEQERLAAELFDKLLREAGLERSKISGVVSCVSILQAGKMSRECVNSPCIFSNSFRQACRLNCLQKNIPLIPAVPQMAAISAGSPKSAWCLNLPQRFSLHVRDRLSGQFRPGLAFTLSK